MYHMATIAKITSKGQTTIPLEIRESLRIKAGDVLSWELDTDGSAHVRPLRAVDREELRSLEGTLREWNSAADEEAYRDL